MSQSPATTPPLRRVVRTGVAITFIIGLGVGAYSFHDALFVAQEAGTHGRSAWLVPLFADGMIVMCSTTLYAATLAKARRPRVPTFGVILGIGVTLALNIAAGLAHSDADALIDALAPVVFLVALEALVILFRLARGGQEPDSPAQCPHEVPGSLEEAVRVDWEHRRDCLGEKVAYLTHGPRWGIDRRRLPELVGAALNGDGHA